MDYGVTPTGFVLKRQEDIEAEVVQALIASFGQIDTDPESVFGQIVGNISFQLALIWEQMESVYNSMYPSTAEGTSLDNAASFLGISRLAATATTAVIELQGTEGSVVPAGTGVSQTTLGYVFNLNANTTITVSACHLASIAVTALASTSYAVTINGNTLTFVSPSGSPTADQIANGLVSVINGSSLVNASVIASTALGSGVLQIETVNFAVTGTFSLVVGSSLSVSSFWTPAGATSTTLGAFPAPAGTLVTIATPVTGLTSVQNLVEGTVGRDVESDSAFRIRRRNSLSVISAGTLGSILLHLVQDVPDVQQAFLYENATGTIDPSGRPGHSFESIVAALNTTSINQAIANSIWLHKPAGVSTYGTTTVNITDSNGQLQPVSFSHASAIYVFVSMTLHITGAEKPFPSTGVDTVTSALLAYGKALSFGDDLLIQPIAAQGYSAGGVTSVDCQIAVSTDPLDPSPIYGSVNIPVSASNYASFDVSRIAITISA